MYFEFMIIGLIGGLLGIFYRNCLKVEDMIFSPLYKKVLKPWALGSTTWITFFLCLLFLTSWEVLPKWQDIVIGVIAASGVQHLVVCAACRWLIHNHPDLDNSHN